MKPKVAAHVRELFPRVRGVDFGQVETIGQGSILLMIRYLESLVKDLEGDIETKEDALRNLARRGNSKADIDVIGIAETSSEITLFRTRLGNRKLAITSLRTAWGGMKKNDVGKDLPALPSLRNSSHFKNGDDVMVYIGKTGLESDSDEIPITDYHWVCGKVLDCADNPGEQPVIIITNNQVFPGGILDGHLCSRAATAPTLFKRHEFFALQKIFQNQSDHSVFTRAFLGSCERRISKYALIHWDDMKNITEIILDDRVELTTDQQLADNKKGIMENALRLTKKDDYYYWQAVEMSKK